MTKYPRGSEWRKWDLHIHSNASDGLSSPKEIIDEAKKKGLSVIALTDHHTVDNVDEIKSLAEQENSGVTVIAGIEFRSEYGEKSVHFIGLFPDSHEGTILNSTALRDLILSPLGISKTAVIAKGRENDPTLDDDAAFKKGMFSVQVDFKEAANLIHRYGGVISIHNGSKSNGLDTEVKHQGVGPHNVKELCESLGTLKEELLKKYVDICEIRKENDSESFYLDTFNLPSIAASDAHKTSEIGQKSVWIKADPTFDGLKQILYEPEDRVRIQEDCPEFKPMYNLIDKVSLNENGFWNQDILINENLNWYTITYDLLYQEDDFASMSPGKQAFVILKLLLEFSSRKCPILIDQPEDSLDNRAIYSELVSYLKTKKKERQIILVSHNPNVVVGSDAEQVIVANQNGIKTINQDNIKFQYISGSLENSSPKIVDETCILLSQGIREHVCDILEGGKEAFNRREKKYGFMR